MQLVEVPYRLDPVSPTRSEGLHVSEIIRGIQNTLYPGKYPEWDPASDPSRLVFGLAWEDYLGRHFEQQRHNVIHNPELVIPPGVYGTADFIEVDKGIVIESKATWKSSRRDIEEDFRPWFWQIKSYCFGTGLNSAQLYVYFVNGDYRDSGPQIKRWDMEFSDVDLDENWDMMMLNAKSFGLLDKWGLKW